MFQVKDTGMHSVTIELLRTGTPHNQTLSPGITYLALCGSHPPAEFRIDLEQYRFNQYLYLLRYKDKNDDSRALAIESLQKIITEIFEKITALLVEASNAPGWLHIRLVMTPKELGMLPFELALTPGGFQGTLEKPFLMNHQRLTTLTREVRQVASKRYEWPSKVRILFAWAEPGAKVPHDEHFSILSKALRPWAYPFRDLNEPVPNVAPLLTEIGEATLGMIKESLEQGLNENNPFTHVHILAHGTEGQNENGQFFELALHGKDKPKPIDGHQLASALTIVKGSTIYCPAVVTITACDSGNTGTPILRSGSLAHALHSSGIPCVFASQFPLSVEGSIKLLDCLYPRLIRGDDPRIALYYTREALNNDSNVHDWASLVAYARFPEDIDEQLEDVRLKVTLNAMEVTNAHADHLLERKELMKSEEEQKAKFGDIRMLIDKSIGNLEALLDYKTLNTVNVIRRAEHYGLIGSAYKRKSEYLHRMPTFDEESAKKKSKESLMFLHEALKWYKKGFDLLPASHWTGGQYLSLTAVLKGTLIHDREKWMVVRFMAEQDMKKPDERIWALGSLAELYLLKPLIYKEEEYEQEKGKAMDLAYECASALIDSESAFAKESTIRQLKRYLYWWPELNGSDGVQRLKEMATELLNRLTAI